MADGNWKNRVGIDINCYSEDEEAYTSTEDNKHFNDDHLSDAEQYSKTPPRTKILRRSRERKQRMTVSNVLKIPTRTSNTKFSRRNTISNVYMNALMANDGSGDSDQGVTNDKRTNKRSLKLLRGSERDLKLDISRAKVGYNSNNDIDDRAESLPIKTPTSIQIETSNRFLSLISRPVLSFDKNNALNYSEPEGCPKNRVDFYKTFSLLIRMGYKENSAQDRHCRRHISQEEQLWQNELKDLIWLQLQAWHADRTVTEQDQYLCKERNLFQNFWMKLLII
ncbi:Mekk1, partial [Carabus blaptoides fortunei]